MGNEQLRPGAGRMPDWSGARVACVWLPRLPLRVEVLRHPAWDGRPLVLGGGAGERREVRLCSPEAERAGLRPGLPLREVLPLCPEAIVVQPDPVRVAEVIEQVLAALQRVSPSVEPAGERLFLDLRGLEGVYQGSLGALERAIRAAVPPLLRPRLGLAGGKFVASVAARLARPAEPRVVRGSETAAFLAPLPIGYLPFEPAVPGRLELLGLATIGDLATLPLGAVQAQLGPAGARAWRLAHGRDDEPIVPPRRDPLVRAAAHFDDPLVSLEAVLVRLEQLLARCFAAPELRGRAARQARLRARLSDGTSWEHRFTFKEAVSNRETAARALRGKLALPNGLPPAPFESLSVELLGLGGAAARQPSLFLTRARQLRAIGGAARQLTARYGRELLYQVVEVEPWSRLPERRWALVPLADGASG